MDPGRLSIVVTVAGVVVGLVALVSFRPGARDLKAALLAGVAVSGVDVAGAWCAHRLDFWHLYGAWSLGHVPLVLNVAWVFLAAAFVLAYDNLWRFPRPRLARALMILGSAMVGVGNDAFFQSLGIIRLGPGMRLPYTFPYWLACIGVGLVTFHGLRKRRA